MKKLTSLILTPVMLISMGGVAHATGGYVGDSYNTGLFANKMWIQKVDNSRSKITLNVKYGLFMTNAPFGIISLNDSTGNQKWGLASGTNDSNSNFNEIISTTPMNKKTLGYESVRVDPSEKNIEQLNKQNVFANSGIGKKWNSDNGDATDDQVYLVKTVTAIAEDIQKNNGVISDQLKKLIKDKTGYAGDFGEKDVSNYWKSMTMYKTYAHQMSESTSFDDLAKKAITYDELKNMDFSTKNEPTEKMNFSFNQPENFDVINFVPEESIYKGDDVLPTGEHSNQATMYPVLLSDYVSAALTSALSYRFGEKTPTPRKNSWQGDPYYSLDGIYEYMKNFSDMPNGDKIPSNYGFTSADQLDRLQDLSFSIAKLSQDPEIRERIDKNGEYGIYALAQQGVDGKNDMDSGRAYYAQGSKIVLNMQEQYDPAYDDTHVIAGIPHTIDQKTTGLPDKTVFSIKKESIPEKWKATIDPSTGQLTVTTPAGTDDKVGKDIVVTVTYPDKSTEDVTAHVTSTKSLADSFDPAYDSTHVEPGKRAISKQKTPDVPAGTVFSVNKKDVPQGWIVSVDETTGDVTASAPDNSKDGDKVTVPVKVTYKDTSVDTVNVEFVVKTVKDSTPGDNTPGDSTPGNSTPGDNTPGDSTPGDSTPGDNTPGDSTPGDSTTSAPNPAPSTSAPSSSAPSSAPTQTSAPSSAARSTTSSSSAPVPSSSSRVSHTQERHSDATQNPPTAANNQLSAPVMAPAPVYSQYQQPVVVSPGYGPKVNTGGHGHGFLGRLVSIFS